MSIHTARYALHDSLLAHCQLRVCDLDCTHDMFAIGPPTHPAVQCQQCVPWGPAWRSCAAFQATAALCALPRVSFSFPSVSLPLSAAQTYAWKLVRVSQYSGSFAYCPDVIPGNGFWLGDSAEAGKDYRFRLWTKSVPLSPPSPPPSPPSPQPPSPPGAEGDLTLSVTNTVAVSIAWGRTVLGCHKPPGIAYAHKTPRAVAPPCGTAIQSTCWSAWPFPFPAHRTALPCTRNPWQRNGWRGTTRHRTGLTTHRIISTWHAWE